MKTPTLAPPRPPEIEAICELDVESATDAELYEAEHLLANFAAPIWSHLTWIRKERERRGAMMMRHFDKITA